MKSVLIDPNQRPFPFLEKTPDGSWQTATEVANAALPILSLFPKIAPYSNLSCGLYQIGLDTYQKQAHLVALKVGNLALPFLFGSLGTLPGHLISASFSVNQARIELQKGNHQNAIDHLINALSSLCFMGSVIYLTPEWIFLSILIQTLHHLSRMKQDYDSKKYILMTSDLILACIRAHSSFFQGKTLFRNHFGEKIKTLQEFNELLREAGKREDHSLNKLFEEKMISSYIENLKETKELIETNTDFHWRNRKNVFMHLDFSDIRIKHSELNNYFFLFCKYANTHIENTEFINTGFYHCHFDKVSLLNSQFRDGSFEECQIVESLFKNILFERVEFESAIAGSTLKNISFIDPILDNSEISFSHLENVSFQNGSYEYFRMYLNEGSKNQFQEADLSKAAILEENIFTFLKCTLPNIENPKIIFPFNIEGVGYYTLMEQEVFTEIGCSTVATRYLPLGVDPDKLKEELNLFFLHTKANSNPIIPSLFKKDPKYPNINQVIAYADTLMQKGDGLLIPGGVDVNPRFYGKEIDSDEFYQNDRDLFELALLDAAKRYEKPVFAICRGSQIANVYHGGTLKDVRGHFDLYEDLSLNPNLPQELREKLQEVLGDTFNFPSMHHQASDQIGEGLLVASEQNGIPKLIVSEDLTQILSQVHPEAAYETWKYWEEHINTINNSIYFRPGDKAIFQRIYEESIAAGKSAKRLLEFFRQQAIHFREKHREKSA